jgi:hypothetical protein
MRLSSEFREGEADPIHPETRFEAGDLNAKAVLLTGAGLLVVLWAIVLLIYPLFSYFENARARSSPPPIQAAAHGTPRSPEPQLQENPQRDLKDVRDYEDAQLNGYQWIDRAQGTISIPIEEAMRIVAARGIPPQPSSGKYFDPQEGTRETGFQGKVEPQ